MILALFTFQCTILATYICVCKNLSFYFSSYFEGSPPTGYPYGVMWWGGGDPPVFLRSHVPKKRFFDEMDQENSEKQEGKNAWMFPVLVCSPPVGNALMIPPS